MIDLIFPGDLYADLSPNRRMNYQARARLTRMWRQRAWHAWYAAGAVKVPPPVRVTLTLYRGREVDHDNLIACCKPIQDALTPMSHGPMQRACLPDDSPRSVAALTVQGVYACRYRGQEFVRVQVEAADKKDPAE